MIGMRLEIGPGRLAQGSRENGDRDRAGGTRRMEVVKRIADERDRPRLDPAAPREAEHHPRMRLAAEARNHSPR